jgi:hypothetical protein
MVKAVIASLVFVASGGLAYSGARVLRSRAVDARRTTIAEGKAGAPAPLTLTEGAT